MFLTIFWGNCPVALPLIAGSANKTCQRHLETGAANVWDLIQSDQWNLACLWYLFHSERSSYTNRTIN